MFFFNLDIILFSSFLFQQTCCLHAVPPKAGGYRKIFAHVSTWNWNGSDAKHLPALHGLGSPVYAVDRYSGRLGIRVDLRFVLFVCVCAEIHTQTCTDLHVVYSFSNVGLQRFIALRGSFPMIPSMFPSRCCRSRAIRRLVGR